MTVPQPAARLCCIDLDTFFVSVERLLDPGLESKPVVVGGRGRRGVVTAASYEVREHGVHSGMPMGQARRLAPHAIYLPTRHGTYSPYAAKVRSILERYSPVVQTASIDEFFVDLRGCERLYALPEDRDDDATIERVVWHMRDTVQDELGLPSSVGVGCTRTIAKIASGLAKPAGVRMVLPGDEEQFVAPLPVRKIPGIGPVAGQRLVSAGIETVGQLLSLPPGPLRARFARTADSVRRHIDPHAPARAGRDRPAFLEHDSHHETVGSISNERTFSADIGALGEVEQLLLTLSERVCWRARKRRVRARTIGLKLRYSDFETLTRSRTLGSPTDDEQKVYACVRQLLRSSWTRDLPIRLVGVVLSNLEGPSSQLSLPFESNQPRSAAAAVDEVRARFGYNAIRLGTTGGSRWLEQRSGSSSEAPRETSSEPPEAPDREPDG